MQKSSFKFILGGGFKRFLLLPFPAWFNHQLVFFWWHKIPPREREREIHFSGCWGVSEGSLRSCFGSIFQSLGERVGNIFAAAPLHILQDVNSWGVGWTFDSKLMKDLQDLLLLWILVQFLKMHQLDFFTCYCLEPSTMSKVGLEISLFLVVVSVYCTTCHLRSLLHPPCLGYDTVDAENYDDEVKRRRTQWADFNCFTHGLKKLTRQWQR